MTISGLFRFSFIVFLAVIGGCAGQSLQYIGNSNEIADAPTPTGFTISPPEANRIRRLHIDPKKTVDDLYHDGDNYYICNGFDTWNRGRGSTASKAEKYGTMISGRTGEVYNRDSEQWEPDPRSEKESPAERIR